MTQEIICKLGERRLNLGHWFILEEIKKGSSIIDAVKDGSEWQTLKRKGYISEDMLTELGEQLLLEVSGGAKKKKAKKEELLNVSEQFDQWWNAYPSTDRVMDGSEVKFPETRGLRTGKKDKVKEKYIEILNEGHYSHKELLDSLKYEVDMRINQSLTGNDNKLTFMKGSLTYLNQASYESFIEIAKLGKKEKQRSNTIII